MTWKTSQVRQHRRQACPLIAFGIGLLCAAFVAASPLLADERLQAVQERLETIRAQLERREAVLERPNLPLSRLVELRSEVVPLRDTVRRFLQEIEPRRTQTEQRLQEFGPAPEPDAPPEAPAITSQRIEQTELLRNIDGTLRQVRVLATRADQLVARIDQERRTVITENLFARSESILDPALWLRAARALPLEARIFAAHLDDWRNLALARAGAGGISLALLAAIVAVGTILFLRRVIRRRTNHRPDTADDASLPMLRKTLLAFRDATLDSAAAPLAAFVALEILSAFALLPERIRSIGVGLVIAILFFSLGRAFARAVLAPTNPARRLPTLGDETARRLYRLISNGVIATAAVLFINAVHRELSVVPELTVATSALYALAIAILIAYVLLAHRAAVEEEGEDFPPWIRLSGWVAVIVITAALLAGYVRFASFLAERLVTAAIALAALALLLALVDAFFGQGLSADSPRRRSIAATLGLRLKTLDLFATLFAGLLRGLLILTAIVLVIGTLTITAIDFTGTLDRANLGIEIGRTQILLGDVLASVVILLLGIVLTRVLYRWLSQVVLPRTEIEPSLQNSIATIVGYIGVIVAISLALGRLGLNLQNVALVAGALSVGIGFGLQSMVSNFVSGLILLTERPIRVGDWIVVGNEQGYVRKISVRSTEIETFERASVILPNSDLITGVVKNWTHSNKLGRLSIPIGVSYSSDPEQVREVLLAAAKAHPQVLNTPEPQVVFVNFGDSALEFELRGVVTDVNWILSVGSDLRFDIVRRFRDAGIEIPFPQRDIHIRTGPAVDGGRTEPPASTEGGQ